MTVLNLLSKCDVIRYWKLAALPLEDRENLPASITPYFFSGSPQRRFFAWIDRLLSRGEPAATLRYTAGGGASRLFQELAASSGRDGCAIDVRIVPNDAWGSIPLSKPAECRRIADASAIGITTILLLDQPAAARWAALRREIAHNAVPGNRCVAIASQPIHPGDSPRGANHHGSRRVEWPLPQITAADWSTAIQRSLRHVSATPHECPRPITADARQWLIDHGGGRWDTTIAWLHQGLAWGCQRRLRSVSAVDLHDLSAHLAAQQRSPSSRQAAS